MIVNTSVVNLQPRISPSPGCLPVFTSDHHSSLRSAKVDYPRAARLRLEPGDVRCSAREPVNDLSRRVESYPGGDRLPVLWRRVGVFREESMEAFRVDEGNDTVDRSEDSQDSGVIWILSCSRFVFALSLGAAIMSGGMFLA